MVAALFVAAGILVAILTSTNGASRAQNASGGRIDLTRHLLEGREAVLEDGRLHLTRRIDIHLRGEFFMFVDETGAQAEHACAS